MQALDRFGKNMASYSHKIILSCSGYYPLYRRQKGSQSPQVGHGDSRKSLPECQVSGVKINLGLRNHAERNPEVFRKNSGQQDGILIENPDVL